MSDVKVNAFVCMVLPHPVERVIQATNKRRIASMSVIGNAARNSNSYRMYCCSFMKDLLNNVLLIDEFLTHIPNVAPH